MVMIVVMSGITNADVAVVCLGYRYGSKHFGKLFGLAMSVSAAFSLLQYPLFVLVQGPLDGNPFLVS